MHLTNLLSIAILSLATALDSNAPEQPQSLSDVICAGRPRTHCEVELDVSEACATDGVGEDPSCPIVFFFHGSGGTNNGFAKRSGVHSANMIGVYPNGERGWNTGPKSTNNCHWSDFSCTSDPDEGDFIASIIEEIRALGGTGNIYAYGKSNGAALAHRLASNGGTRLPIKGIIVGTTQLLASPERSGPGTLNYNQPSSTRGVPPVSILSILGDADPVIPYEGGSAGVFGGDEAFQLMPALDSMSYWASHNGCTGSPQTSQHTTDMGDGTATKYDYTAGCPNGIYVEHYTIHGGQHNAGGAEVDGAKIDVLGFVAKVEGETPSPPSSSPPTPTPPTSGCDNDPTWSGKFNLAHTCDYVALNPARRCSFENSEGATANAACPGACNSSCSTPPATLSPVASPVNTPTPTPSTSECNNDPTWSGKFNLAHTCDYVALNPARRCSFENSEGVTASDACPGACNSSCSTPPATLSPVASPHTSSPDASPVNSPTPPPSTSECNNDPTWIGKFNTAHTCDYVSLNPGRRCSFENSEGVTANDSCPGACDSSCATPPETLSSVASPVTDRPILSGFYTSITLPTGQGGCSGIQEAVLDIYPSSSGSAAPTVLHLPGGAYMNLVGDTVESAGQQYINAGYTVAVLYYRLPRSAATTSWLVCSNPHEALDDVSAAMTHLQENAVDYNVDTDQVVLSGFSAGGHLASLYSSLCNGRSSACPTGQVLHFPFLEKGSKIFCSEVGTAFNALQEYDECYPTHLVDDATPRTVLYHAGGDPIVPTSEMTDFVFALEQQGVSYEYYEVSEGGGHYLVPFSQVAAVSGGVLDPTDDYASLVERALMLPSPTCARCDDIETPWMTDNDKTCDETKWLISNKCKDDPNWVTNGYCRSSCYAAGRGYANEMCCPTPAPSSSCTECSDDSTPWMENNAKTCVTSLSSIESNCNANDWWISNNYCQQSCFDAGRGYEGIDCCA